jgi:acid phosphatase family membrane protein YuiD
MPSSHSANVTALAVTVGMLNGFGSALFGIAAGFAAIVMYDAMHVRRAVGEQGTVLRKIIERDAKLELEVSELLRKKPADKLRKPYFTRGHRGIEVAVGGIIGAVIGCGVCEELCPANEPAIVVKSRLSYEDYYIKGIKS